MTEQHSRPFTARLALAAAFGVVFAVLAAGTAVAATPPVAPEGGETSATVPWGAIVGVVAVAAVLAMIRWPWTRPFIASLGTLAVAGFIGVAIVFIGSFANYGSGGAVPLPYLLAAGGVLVAGIGLSVWLGSRLSRRTPGPS
jgi:hypothetical protein